MEWVPMSGEGKLVTFTTIAVGTSAMEAKGFGRDRHYCCGVVELDEGPKVCAFITGVDVQNPANIKINTPVSVEFPEGEDELSVLTFRAGRSG